MAGGEQHRATRVRQFKDLMLGKGESAEECERDSKGQGRLVPPEASSPLNSHTHMTGEGMGGGAP